MTTLSTVFAVYHPSKGFLSIDTGGQQVVFHPWPKSSGSGETRQEAQEARDRAKRLCDQWIDRSKQELKECVRIGPTWKPKHIKEDIAWIKKSLKAVTECKIVQVEIAEV